MLAVVTSVARAPDRMPSAVTRHTRLARSAATSGPAASKPSFPNPTTRRATENAEDHAAAGPVGLDVADYKNRNVIERRYCHIKQWRGLATRYDKHAVTYRAAVLLNATIVWTKTLSGTP